MSKQIAVLFTLSLLPPMYCTQPTTRAYLTQAGRYVQRCDTLETYRDTRDFIPSRLLAANLDDTWQQTACPYIRRPKSQALSLLATLLPPLITPHIRYALNPPISPNLLPQPLRAENNPDDSAAGRTALGYAAVSYKITFPPCAPGATASEIGAILSTYFPLVASDCSPWHRARMAVGRSGEGSFPTATASYLVRSGNHSYGRETVSWSARNPYAPRKRHSLLARVAHLGPPTRSTPTLGNASSATLAARYLSTSRLPHSHRRTRLHPA